MAAAKTVVEGNGMGSPWELQVEAFDADEESRREALFGVGNGLMFVRACAPEAEAAQPADDTHYAGFYRAAGYNQPLRMANGAKAHVAALINLPNPFSLSFRAADGDWLTADATHSSYLQRLDMRHGIAERSFVVRDDGGRETQVHETRLASLTEPDVSLLRWTLTPLNWSGPMDVRSRLSLHVANTNIDTASAYEGRHVSVAEAPCEGGNAVVARSTDGRRAFHVAAWLVAGNQASRTGRDADALWQTATIDVAEGRAHDVSVWVRLNDLEAADAAAPSVTCPTTTADDAVSAQAAAWHELWQRMPIELPRHVDVERACRFSAFQMLQARTPMTADLDAGMPARSWQEGYFGQIFWDELLVSGFLSTHVPEISRALLAYRHRRLPAAQRAAQAAGRSGAMFPWRSATTGDEETPPYQWIPPAKRWKRDHTYLQRHVGAAIAFNAWHHFCATGNEADLAGECGELIVEVARFWCSAVQPGPSGRLEIHGVVGPDEYHDAYPGNLRPGFDNNAYTNVMAAWTLRCAASLPLHMSASNWLSLCDRLQIQADELAQWEDRSRRLKLPLLDHDVIAQFDGYDLLEPNDSPALAGRPEDERADWWLMARGDDVNRYQLSKQADVLVLCHLFGEDGLQDLVSYLGYDLAPGWYARTVRYYLDHISHESSLSRPICAGALACMDADASWEHFLECMQSDFGGKASSSTYQGVHLGAMAGGWDVLQRWYLGLRPHAWGLLVSPCPPTGFDEARTAVQLRGLWIDVQLRNGEIRLDARAGDAQPLTVEWRGERHELAPGSRLVFQLTERGSGTPCEPVETADAHAD